MKAIVIRKEREGDPIQSMQVEEVPVPELGPNDVLVLVMAAGVNFNGVWAAQGKPVSVFRMHKEPFHIAGSDASGIVWKVGKEVRRWKVGDEVVIHCNQSCGQCPECNGLDPMACSEQKIWGYETSWGSFAQFTKVQAQQLVQKPKQLGWEEAASYGLTYFTAYRMLVGRAQVKPGDNVLVWGAAGGLGIFAIQICKILGANPIAVVSSPDKIRPGQVARRRAGVINRKEFDFAWRPNETPEQRQEAHGRDQAPRRRDPQAHRRQGSRRRLRARRAGDLPRQRVLVQALRQDRHLRRDLGLRSRVRRALPVDAAEGDPRLALRQRLSGRARQRAGAIAARSSRCSIRCSTSTTRRRRTS